MPRIDKAKTSERICENLHLGYIKNKDGKTTNPTLYLHARIDLKTNQFSDISYSVNAYKEKTTHGYHRSEHASYEDAKKVYDDLFKYHVESDGNN